MIHPISQRTVKSRALKPTNKLIRGNYARDKSAVSYVSVAKFNMRDWIMVSQSLPLLIFVLGRVTILYTSGFH